MSLEDKLKEILEAVYQAGIDSVNFEPVGFGAAADIIQAFRDEGWSRHDWTISPEGVVFDGTQYYTGQEWKETHIDTTIKSRDDAIAEWIDRAAKKASGL